MLARHSRDARRAVVGASLCALAAATSLALPRPAHVAPLVHVQPPPAPLPRVVAPAPEATPPRPPRTFDEGDAVVVEPRARRASGDAPVTVVLHGICGHAERICAPFADAASARGWLVCPRGPSRCDDGAMWLPGERSPATLEAILARADAAHDGAMALDAPRTLVGFSLGASAALDVATRAHGEWDALVLLSADVRPDARALRAAGVKSVLLAAGDKDMMRPIMEAAAQRLADDGLRARYMSLGAVGHALPPDMPAWSERALAWVRGDDDRL